MFRPLELFIGLRYTRAKRRNHFISFISMVSMIGIALGVITAIGGYCMLRGRGYYFAFAGCIAAAFNINELACCVPGAISGFWGILILVRDDGRRYFGISPR